MTRAGLLKIVREANLAGQERLRDAGKMDDARHIADRVESERLSAHIATIAPWLQRADPEVLRSWLICWGWGRHSLLTREFERRTAKRHKRLLQHAEAMCTLVEEQLADEGEHPWFYFPGRSIRPAAGVILSQLRAWEWRILYAPDPRNENALHVRQGSRAPSEQSILHQRDAARPLLAYLRKIGLSRTTRAPTAAAVLLWYAGLLGKPAEPAPDDLIGTLSDRVLAWEKLAR